VPENTLSRAESDTKADLCQDAPETPAKSCRKAWK